MPQTNASRRHSQNVNTDRVEYHYIENISQAIIDSAVTGYTYIPAPEAIALISTQPKIIKIIGYHYRLSGTVEPSGQTWDSSNTFPALYANDTYITVYTTASASTPNYLKIGTDIKGYKYYQKVNEESYYELIGKMPNELEYGELGIGRSANNEVMYIKNSYGQMVEFRSYKANMNYVNNEITDVYNLIYSIHYVPSWSVSRSTIFKATDTNETATAKLTFNGTSQTEFGASTPSGWTVGTTSGTTRTFTKIVNITSNTTITTTITKDAYAKTMSTTITPVNHIFYGQYSGTGVTLIKISEDDKLSAYNTAKTSAQNISFDVTMTAGNYFYLAVPESLTQATQVGVGGWSGFFEEMTFVGAVSDTDYVNGQDETYNFYRTPSPQTAGNKTYYVK